MPAGPIRIVIVASVRLYVEGLRHALGSDDRFRIVASAESLPAGLERLRTAREDAHIALVDLDLRSAAAQLERLRREAPTTRIVVLGVREEDDDVIAWTQHGVHGFVSRSATLDELRDALIAVAAGEACCTPRMVAALMRRVASMAAAEPPRELEPGARRLTAREHEILELIAAGLTNKAIAGRLQIELPTVKNHVHHILDKLEVDGRGGAAAHLRAREAVAGS